MKKRIGFSQPSTSKGFSLIEVLVTLVIVIVGLLGLASLMLKGLQTNASSQLRTVAVSQAYDIADRMRANVVGVRAGNYDSILPPSSTTTCSTTNLGTTAHVQPSSSAITCSTSCTTSCSVADVASMDGCSWNLSNASLLPEGAGAVCKDAANNWYTIYVSWDDGKAGSATKTFTMRFEP